MKLSTTSTSNNLDDSDLSIAIVSMVGRFPGADSVAQLWELLRSGKEGIRTFTQDELAPYGVTPSTYDLANFVARRGYLSAAEDFESQLFGYSRRECQLIDPQQRLLLECAWAALNDAALDPKRFAGSVGVFTGVGMNTWMDQLYTDPDLMENVNGYQLMIANDKDFASTRISYQLDLHGPSIGVQTACSTSLVAVAMACQSLAAGQCDAALAGAASLIFPRKGGYFYQEGMILSPDGHCRSFDSKAQGTVPGEGVAVVLLKRLEDAIADRDHIEAVIRGWAINNDGNSKVGFTAPSVDGQAEVIRSAINFAQVSPQSIGYIEAHGTATPLGDPIEVAALCEAFAGFERSSPCALGSIKSNVGHLDTAAGIAGLIKASLALKHQQIPASLHFEKANAEIDFDGSPFRVATQLQPWHAAGQPRRAGVSSFGIGGTNCHLVLEEAPERARAQTNSKSPTLITFSAASHHSSASFQEMLADSLTQSDSPFDLTDVAYTLWQRPQKQKRRALVGNSIADVVDKLRDPVGQSVFAASCDDHAASNVFMFPGQGTQHVEMGRGLYEAFPVFRRCFDECAEIFNAMNARDRVLVKLVLYESSDDIHATQFAQPALFAIEYSLAKQLIAWGVVPSALIGHSVGEYVAACLAGVMRFDDAMRVVIHRGRLMSSCQPGAMLAVATNDLIMLRQIIVDRADIAAINSPSEVVISGTTDNINQLQLELKRYDVSSVPLRGNRAFHSALMEPIVSEFESLVGQIPLNVPVIPIVSTVTGKRLTQAEAMSAKYWANGIRSTVQFASAIGGAVSNNARSLLIEVGPARVLQSLARRAVDATEHRIVSTMRSASSEKDDATVLLEALAELWVHGAAIDDPLSNVSAFRVSLPAYVFERQTFSVSSESSNNEQKQGDVVKKQPMNKWFYRPTWQRALTPQMRSDSSWRGNWLVFCDSNGLGRDLGLRLFSQGHRVTYVWHAESFQQIRDDEFCIKPQRSGDVSKLLGICSSVDRRIDRIVHCWLADSAGDNLSSEQSLQLGFYSLLFLCQSLGRSTDAHPVRIDVVTCGVHDVIGNEQVSPSKATARAPIIVAPQEYPHIKITHTDLQPAQRRTGFQPVDPHEDQADRQWQCEMLFRELSAPATGYEIAYRGRSRWQRTFESITLDNAPTTDKAQRGAWIVLGGFGQIGLTTASWIAVQKKSPIVLVSRSAMPAHDLWDSWVREHDANDMTCLRIEAMRQLIDLGANLSTDQSDLSEIDSLRDVFRRAVESHGRIVGVIHSAGLVQHRIIHYTSPSDCETMFAAKMEGIENLAQLCSEFMVPQCIVHSSLSSILGGLGFCGYTASNLYLDAFVAIENKKAATQWKIINWDGWVFPMIADYYSHSSPLLELTLSAEEGFECLDRIAGSVQPQQIVVSTGDLQQRLAQWVYSKPSHSQSGKSPSDKKPRHPRPNLSVPYEAPATDVQKAVASVWQDMLGIDQVGLHDDYIALGGHSLLAGQIVGRLRQQLKTSLSIRALFEFRTVAQLAMHIMALRLTYDGTGIDLEDKAEIEL